MSAVGEVREDARNGRTGNGTPQPVHRRVELLLTAPVDDDRHPLGEEGTRHSESDPLGRAAHECSGASQLQIHFTPRFHLLSQVIVG